MVFGYPQNNYARLHQWEHLDWQVGIVICRIHSWMKLFMCFLSHQPL